MFRETLQRNAARRESARQAIGILFALIFLCYSALAVVPGARAQSNGFQVVGTQLARAILHKRRHSVAVVDFSGPGQKVTVLGQQLADAVSAALAKAGGKLRVEDRSQVANVRQEESFAPGIVLDPESLLAFGQDLKVKSIVAGDLKLGQNHSLTLDLHVYRMPDGRGLAALKVTLPMTAEMKSLMVEPAPPAIKPLMDSTRSVSPAIAGYKPPRCISCPAAEYTGQAMADEVEGTIVLRATINLKGRATNIIVIRALPDGLTARAINDVKTWKLQPAILPNGKPVPVRQTIEMPFRLVR